MKKISMDAFLRLRKLVYRNARPLDYTMWKYLFENGSADDFLGVLSAYQNEDGGFGHNLECNNWNPDSSPYTVCIALDYLDVAGDAAGGAKDAMVSGIIKYLASGAYLLADGWVGMQGVPGNNAYAHMPWFHFSPEKAAQADVGVTKRLSDFILRYADKGSDIYSRAAGLKERYQSCEQVLLEGYPDYDPTALNIQAYDPATWPAWLPLPVYFIGSPQSSHYAACRQTVDRNLDTIADSLLNPREVQLASPEELDAYERSNPHPDGKRWCVAEQTIGNYYWGAHFIVRDLNLLRKFGRLDFALPVCAR
ncbi:MAG: hypothetical protein PHD32_03515 [Eubacteriales bacterium]|nr:hypothetical protein [Eubacteriales bacterium]